MADLRFRIPRAPRGKGRPRWAKRTGHAYTDDKTRTEEEKIANYVSSQYSGPPLSGALTVSIYAHFKIPKSLPRAERMRRALSKYHTQKPDADNIGKLVTDALNGILWGDDSQIAVIKVAKFWNELDEFVTIQVEDQNG